MSITAADADRGPITAPGRRRHPPPGGRRLLSAWSTIALLALTGLLAFGILQEPTAPSQSASAVQPAWVELGKALRFYSLETQEYGREPLTYEARRHRTGGGRQDFLTYGPGFTQGPYLRIAIYRPGTEPVPASGFYLELARGAALAGVAVTRSTVPAPLQTRFGAFDVADFVLAEGTTTRACLGFRLKNEAPQLYVTGFACPASGNADRSALGCTLERLDLLAAGEDGALASFFASAELRRSATCLSALSEKPALRNAVPPQKVVSASRRAGPSHRSSLD